MAESGGINLGALSLEQLNQLRQSIEEVRRLPRRRRVEPLSARAHAFNCRLQEMQGLRSAHQQLKVSSDKLVVSKHSLEQLQKTEEGATAAFSSSRN